MVRHSRTLLSTATLAAALAIAGAWSVARSSSLPELSPPPASTRFT